MARVWTFLLCWTLVLGADQDDFINWEDSRLIGLLGNALSTSDSPCDSGTLAKIIDTATGGTGSLHVPLDVQQDVPTLGTLNITGVTIAGLDTITTATILQPQDSFYLSNHLELSAPVVALYGRAYKSALIGKDSYSSFYLEVRAGPRTSPP